MGSPAPSFGGHVSFRSCSGTRRSEVSRPRLVVCVAFAVLIVAPPAGSAQAPSPAASTPAHLASLIGIIGDSLHGGPLAGATVMVDGQPSEGTTDSIGRFRIDSIEAGQHRLGIFHPILDSLGSSLASRPVKFVAGKPLLVTLATPSGRTIRHAVCPEVPVPKIESGDSGIAVVVGRVLDPENEDPISDARISLTWIETAFDHKGFRVVTHTRQTTSDASGDFHFCALPSGLVGDLRATSGAGKPIMVERELDLGERILTITMLHLPVPRATAGDPSGGGVVIAARAALSGTVVRPDGSPLEGATAIVEGTPDSAVTNELGAFHLKGLPTGTHMLVVRVLGFEPVSAPVELANSTPRVVSIAMLTPAHLLSPVLVQARQLQAAYARVGFDRRQRAGNGQFLTLDDIARKNALDFDQLFTTTPGIRLSYRGGGGSNIESSQGVASCLIYVIDGHPFNRLIDGELDALYQPEDLGGIEIYSPAAVPEEFRVMTMPTTNPLGVRVDGRTDCTTVVVWTKTHLGITNADPSPTN